MVRVLSRFWWVLALRGVVAVILGILLLTLPVPVSIASLITFFGAYMLVDGVMGLIHGFQERATNKGWWAQSLEGVIGIIVGIVVLIQPPTLTAIALLYFIAAWAVVTGIFEIIAAIRLREEIEGEFWLGLSGLASVVFGVLLIVMNPAEGILTLLWLAAVYAIMFGIVMVILAFRLRGLGDTAASRPA